VDKTIMEADQDHDGKISFEEFTKMVENTDVSMSMTLGTFITLPWFSRYCKSTAADTHFPQTNFRSARRFEQKSVA
jgi:hypothetical protein